MKKTLEQTLTSITTLQKNMPRYIMHDELRYALESNYGGHLEHLHHLHAWTELERAKTWYKNYLAIKKARVKP